MSDFDIEKMKKEFAAEIEKVFAEDFEEIFADELAEELAEDIADMLNDKIVLYDEDGNAEEFKFFELIEYENKEYVVLFPLSQKGNTGGVVILQVAESDSETSESYVSVDDEETLMAVYNIFKEKCKYEFNFLD